MNTIDELLRFILRHDHVVVFGNLGRYPHLVFNALLADEQLNVVIQSPYYTCPSSSDNRIRVVEPHQSTDPCDLLVVMEPTPYRIVEKPANATRIVVFTSHFTYATRQESTWIHVSFFHTESAQLLGRHTQDLLKLQDNSIQTHNIQQVQVNAVHVQVLQGRSATRLEDRDTYVLIDLTRYTDPFTMYLAFWDAFDFLLAYKDFIKGWMICFSPKHGRRAFDQFCQNSLDSLFCKSFEVGNVTELGKVLAILPFYKSGCIDRTFNIPKHTVLGVDFIAPNTPEEVCKSATMYNLEYWTGNIYRIKI